MLILFWIPCAEIAEINVISRGLSFDSQRYEIYWTANQKQKRNKVSKMIKPINPKTNEIENGFGNLV